MITFEMNKNSELRCRCHLSKKNTTIIWIKLGSAFTGSVPDFMIFGINYSSFLSGPRSKHNELIVPYFKPIYNIINIY